jgi:predicted metalloendopeptidase
VNFDFYSRQLRGQLEQKPLNERVLRTTSGALGEALGKLYVKEYFPPEAKAIAVQMVEDLRTAYRGRINALPWMSDETKAKAIEKLNSFRVKIGYPDTWKDYSDLKVETYDNGGSYYGNLLNARKWRFDKNIAKIGKPVDKDEWFMSPQTVNAYYNPPYNEIVFPAAILQAPFFDFKADPASNYGGIGGVIGHEFSHGFDDQGAKYDAEGNLNNWWTDADLAAFEERGNKLVAQYNKYEPLPGVFVNGKFTLGENIGDLGGVNAAYDALQIRNAREGKTPKIDGLTQDERFFINWASIWRTKMRDEAMKNRIKTDPHAPGVYRATGPLVNIEAFYKTFDIKPGDPMYKAPEDRVIIW